MLRIYGAGMAGLLAANMLRRFNPVIYEAQPSLPDNHGALLRFRSEAVSQATGQPFKKVRVAKAVMVGGELRAHSTLKLNNSYSRKVTGEVMDRSVLNLAPVDRYVAPDNFLSTMANGLDIRYGEPLIAGEIKDLQEHVISTIPMPSLMDMVGWKDMPEFKWRSIRTNKADITDPPTNVNQTIYYPESFWSQYRASITGNHLMVESSVDAEALDSLDLNNILHYHFGIMDGKLSEHTRKIQKHGKLVPIDERLRRRFIIEMSNRYGIFSVGRFATWRQILLDDLVQDINLISGWLSDVYGYDRNLHYGREG